MFKYIKGETIGKGTFGPLYPTLNGTTGKSLALKQLEFFKPINDQKISWLVRVIERLTSGTGLEHTNIARCLGFEQTADFLSVWVFLYSSRDPAETLCSYSEYESGGSIGPLLRKPGRFDHELVLIHFADCETFEVDPVPWNRAWGSQRGQHSSGRFYDMQDF
jgi:mitogen-activated protein kinase kinase kinase